MPTTDADLLRVAEALLLAIVSVLGATALLVPRPSVSLSYTESRGEAALPAAPSDPKAAEAPPTKNGAATDGTSTQDPPTPPDGSATPATNTSVVAREPALVQGVAAAVVIGALVFGINTTDAKGLETVFNVLAPTIPIVGAFFVRRRVKTTPRSV